MNPTIPLLAALAAGLLLAAPASAADKICDACMAKAVTNPDYGQCGSGLVEREDARLNAVWRRVYPKLDPARKPKLLAQQRKWIAAREKSCTEWLEDNGREGQVIDFPICRAEFIADRTAALEGVGKTPGR